MSFEHRIRTVTITLCALAVVVLGGPAAAAHAAGATVATPGMVNACQTERTSDAKTANVPERVSGAIVLAGCVADDGSGVSHLYVDWSGPGGASGHVCADPAIDADGAWHCTWDTTGLPHGAYTVTLTAYDLAGNGGSFDRKYEVMPQAGPDAAAIPTSPTPETTPTTTPAIQPAPPSTTTTTQTATTSTSASTDQTSTTPAAPVPPPATDDAPTNALPIGPQLPTADGLDAVQRLVLDQIEQCAQLQAASLAAHPSTAPDAAAQVALTCVQPALVELGATSEGVDELPVPPALQIVFPDAASLAYGQQVLPLTIAGVPLELETQAQLTAAQAAQAASGQTATTSTSTTATAATSTSSGAPFTAPALVPTTTTATTG